MLRLARSIVGPSEAQALARVITQDGYLGMGAEVAAFEQELAGFLGVSPEMVCCVSSGTAALHLAVEALTEPGDEVIVPSLTYVASFQAISAAQAVPVACEVLANTATIDLVWAESLLSERTRAIMPVHYASYPHGLDAVYTFAQRHGLRVVEDAAHAFGCRHREKLIGSFGDIICFSFDGIKNITSGEGGLIVSHDPAVAALARDARLLAVQKDSEKRYTGQRSWDFDVSRQGWRYHMSNLFAALGRVQLERFVGEFAPARQRLAGLYRQKLASLREVVFLSTDPSQVVPHIMPVRVLNGKRDVLRAHLEERGVGTGVHYKPNHLLTYFGGGQTRLPVTEALYGQLLSLPLHPGLSEEDVSLVCELVEAFFKQTS